MAYGGVDYEAVKLQEQAMRNRVLQRAKEHPPKPMSAGKLFLILGIAFFILFAVFIVFSLAF